MFRKSLNVFMILAMVVGMFAMVPAASAAPPAPDDGTVPASGGDVEVASGVAPRHPKAYDWPTIKDGQRVNERIQLLDAGQTAEAAALATTGTRNVLVLLVEFAGTDSFTWEAGVSHWDPYGIADPAESTGIAGDCSLIITQTQTFTYTGPLHNEIPRPLSPDDRSGDSIWTEDFSRDWFEDFMFKDGVVISYTMDDGTPVQEDYTGQSVTNFYQDMSGGTFTVTGDVVGWIQVPHSTWYYDADACPGDRSGLDSQRGGMIPGAGSTKDLLRDAIDAVQAQIDAGTLTGFDWTKYDNDGDGQIESVWLVHSGYGEEDSTTLLNRTDYGEAAVWSHSSSIAPYPVYTDTTTSQVTYVSPYIMMPEAGGMAVFAHEFGHNIGADDLYAYGQGETSAGFWTLMSDSWVGYPIGFGINSFDPWHMDYTWGWLDDSNMMTIDDPDQVYEFTLGQASMTPEGTYRAAKIALPDSLTPLAVQPWDGEYYYWSGKEPLSNGMLVSTEAISVPSTTPVLSFTMNYDIEDEWDFLWVAVVTDTANIVDVEADMPSIDGMHFLTNANTQCVHHPDWIGYLYGFPDDLCAAGIGGFYGYNLSWPVPETQAFDLSAFAGEDVYLVFWYMTDWGTEYSGAFIDNIEVSDGTTPVFSDDAETEGAFSIIAPFERNNGYLSSSQNFYLQWRNVEGGFQNAGYDFVLGDPRYRFGPTNDGLIMWYNNNFYGDNEIWTHFFDSPSIGPKGRMLVMDAHSYPYRDPALVAMGYDNEGGNVTSRALVWDAPFNLNASTGDWTLEDPYIISDTYTFSGRPGVNAWHDAIGYYPGVEYVSRGSYYDPPSYKWVTADWDASAVVPAKQDYAIQGEGYTANDEFRFNCSPFTSGPFTGALSCYWLGSGTGLGYDGGTGNPGDEMIQYGWHVEVTDSAEDGTWGSVRVWNSMYAADTELERSADTFEVGDIVTSTINLQNTGSPTTFLVCATLDEGVSYVEGSASTGALLLESCPESATAIGGEAAAAADVGAIAWVGHDLPTEGEMWFEYAVSIDSVLVTMLSSDVKVYTPEGEIYTSLTSDTVTSAFELVFLPLVEK